MSVRRRRLIARVGSKIASTRADRLLFPLLTAASLASILLAYFYRQIEAALKPTQPAAQEQPAADIIARRVSKAPVSDPESPVWKDTPAYSVSLYDQSIVRPLKTARPNQPITVKAVYDDEWIVFRLSFRSEKPSKRSVKVAEFRDACAVLLARHPAAPEARFMGTADNPATILHWKADWQLDVEEGFQDLENAFPNVTADYYPPLKGVVVDGKPPKTVDVANKAVMYFPALNAGNPLSEPIKKTPVEKLIGRGPGTLATLPAQDASGWGLWRDGSWHVVLAKRLKATDSAQGEIDVEPGKLYACAFSVWFGSEGDRGSRKNPSMLLTLLLQ